MTPMPASPIPGKVYIIESGPKAELYLINRDLKMLFILAYLKEWTMTFVRWQLPISKTEDCIYVCFSIGFNKKKQIVTNYQGYMSTLEQEVKRGVLSKMPNLDPHLVLLHPTVCIPNEVKSFKMSTSKILLFELEDVCIQ